jgi:hypothetical protein
MLADKRMSKMNSSLINVLEIRFSYLFGPVVVVPFGAE